MQLTMKKMGAAVAAAALALCVAPATAMLAPGVAHADVKTNNITKLYHEGDLDIDIETEKFVKTEQWNGGHSVSTATYNGKAKMPKVEVRAYDPDYDGKRTEKYWDDEKKKIVKETYSTKYRSLKVVNITGKSKAQAKKLIKQKKADITVEYKNHKNIGTAQVILKGVGKYKGTVYSTFNIIPAQVKTVKVKTVRKALNVSWKKVKGATGYQVVVRDKDAKEVVKTMTVSAKKTSATVKGLKGKRAYEVSVRPYAADVKSAYKTTESVRYDEKYETVTDEDGWGDEKLVSYKTLNYTGSYESNSTYWGDYSVAKVKKIK